MAKDKRTSIYFDRKTLCFVGLEDAHIQQLKDAYKGVDVESEFKKMGLWLVSPRGKRRKGDINFIMNWLNNANSSRAPIVYEQSDLCELVSPLRPFLREYLSGLWKGREHILALNKIKRES